MDEQKIREASEKAFNSGYEKAVLDVLPDAENLIWEAYRKGYVDGIKFAIKQIDEE